MALDLTLNVEVKTNDAKRALADVEQGIKKVESAAKGTEAPIAKVTAALSSQRTEATKLEQTTRTLTASHTAQSLALGTGTAAVTRHLTAMGLLSREQAAVARGMTSFATAAGLSGTAVLGLAAGITAVVTAGAGLIGFLVQSGRMYLEQSGILHTHRRAIDGVKDAFQDMFIQTGRALIGGNADIRDFLGSVEGGVRTATTYIESAILRVKSWAATIAQIRSVLPTTMGGNPAAAAEAAGSGFGYLPFAFSVGPVPNAQTALRNPDGSLTAFGRMEESRQRRIDAASVNFMLPYHAMGSELARDSTQYLQQTQQEREANAKKAATQRSQFFQWLSGGPINYDEGLRSAPGVELPIGRPFFQSYLPALEGGVDMPYGRSGLTSMPGTTLPIQMPTYAQGGFFRQAFGGASQFGGMLGGSILSAVQGGRSILGSIGSSIGGGLGSQLGALASKNIGGLFGGALNSVLPGVGALLGPALGWLGGLFGPSKGKLENLEANKQIAGLQSGLLSQYGSVANIKAIGPAGAELAAAWGDQSVQGLANFQQKMQDFTSTANQGLNDMVRNAITAGQAIPAGMEPVLTSLIKMGGLTQENANLLMGLPAKGVPSFKEIQAAAGELGIEIGKLGPAVEQIKINEEALRAADAFDVLTRAGVNADDVIRGASGKIQSMVETALNAGLTLPASMKPIVDRMKDLGLFTGDAKDKLDDLVFKPTLEQSVQNLIDKMGLLIDKLNGPQGLEGAIGRVDGRQIDVGVNFVANNEPTDAYRGGGEYAHLGGFVTPFGVRRMHRGGLASDEYPAILQTGEFVFDRPSVNRIGVSTLSRLQRGGSAASGGGVTVNVTFAQPVMANDYTSLSEFADFVARAIEHGYSSRGHSLAS